jgi:hypothetical protein
MYWTGLDSFTAQMMLLQMFFLPIHYLFLIPKNGRTAVKKPDEMNNLKKMRIVKKIFMNGCVQWLT